jgi:lipopolysaccharide/colanic/teichoic acid biosynthesis glycosyltransferase
MSSSPIKPYTGKRALDLLVAGTACAAFAPFVAGIAVAERVTRFAANPDITRRLDRLYLARQSLMLDLRLIALSCAVNLAGKRNVRRWLKAAE